jgi:hypothetical protein
LSTGATGPPGRIEADPPRSVAAFADPPRAPPIAPPVGEFSDQKTPPARSSSILGRGRRLIREFRLRRADSGRSGPPFRLGAGLL